MQQIIYAVAVGCFVWAGCLDATHGEWKLAVVAWLFAVANGVIFLWR